VQAGGDERSDRLFKVEWVYFIERQVSLLEFTKQPGVSPAARAEGFEGNSRMARLTQM